MSKFIIVIVSKTNLENIERWNLTLKRKIKETTENGDGDGVGKSRQEIQKIRAIIRQITSLVSYLPVLKDDDEYTFNVLVYTDPNTSIPIEWCDTQGDGKVLDGDNVDNVKFTSFSTDIHQVGTSVSYKYE